MAVLLLAVSAGTGMLLRDLQRVDPVAEAGEATGGTSAVVAPAEQPGPRTVTLLAGVRAHPAADEVRALLQEYFDAINTGDYEQWSGTVTAERVQKTGRRAWTAQYRSTLDGSIVVYRLEARPGGGLVALLSFTSAQDPVDAPPDMPLPCLRWRVSYPLAGEPGELRLAPASPNASQRTPC
ncbi:MAG: hypothetical protein ACRDRV_00510 [Pseudonocardiaceae bacterium]